MKRFHTYSLVLGILLLALLIWKIGLGPLLRELALVGWGLVPLILIEGVADLFRTQGWRHCLSGPHRSLSFFQVFRIRMAGIAINCLTPTAGLGGEVTKGALLSLNHRGAEAATGVIVGKLAEALAQLLFVAVGSITILWGIHLSPVVWLAMLSGTVLLAGGMLGFLVLQKCGKLGGFLRWFVAHRVGGQTLERAACQMTEVDHELKRFYRERPMDLPFAILWHIAGLACGIVQGWYFLFLLTDHPSLTMAAGVWFLGSWFDLLSFAVPYNIGVLETTRVIAFRALGFHPAMGLTYGVTLRLEQLFWAGIGLLLYATLMAERRDGEENTRRGQGWLKHGLRRQTGQGVDV
jgi:uncharacterized protein (TIRG00374 family)